MITKKLTKQLAFMDFELKRVTNQYDMKGLIDSYERGKWACKYSNSHRLQVKFCFDLWHATGNRSFKNIYPLLKQLCPSIKRQPIRLY